MCDNSTIAPTTDKSIFHTPLLQHSQFFLHYIAKNIDLYSRYYRHPVQCLCFPERICFYLFMYLCLVSCLEPLVAEILLLPEYSEYLCICICVFVYLQFRQQGALFLRSWNHYLFKNIAHGMSICNVDQCCMCVFVYLCICKSDTWEHCLCGPLTITFSKI